jgi:hypothetical protein
VRPVTYELDGAVGCGVVGALSVVPILGATIRGILEHGGEHWRAVVQYASEHADEAVPLEDVRLLAPVQDPDKILCIGLNYRDHAGETGIPAPPAPVVFAKFRNSLTGPTDPIVLPEASEASTTRASSPSSSAEDAGTSTRQMRWSSSPGDRIQRRKCAGPADADEPVDDG